MLFSNHHAPIFLNAHEQIVVAIAGRTMPSLSDFIFILLLAPAWFFSPLLILHRVFRPITYVITTQRILVVEPKGTLDAIRLDDIVRVKGTKTSLMVQGHKKRMWLARLPDAWFFESVANNVIEKVASGGRQ